MTAEFAYNGLGDRLQQTVAGQTVNYTLDLNAGLTQVLADGTNTYLYGVDRLAQTHAGTDEFFLGDALGSVRQLVDANGALTLTQAYEPYGSLAATEGTGASIYGFTGEIGDQTGLVYLRARYYAPEQGRFMTRDAWGGGAMNPSSYDRWEYVRSNPINLTDPSGRDPWWCEGQYEEDLCRIRWDISHGAPLSAGILKSTYLKYPDEILELLQRAFRIRIPSEYRFRLASSENWDPHTLGAGIWFAESNWQPGSILEFSDNQCALLSLAAMESARHIDYSIYVTKRAFTDYDYSPDDIAGVMMHEAVHAWQEDVARDNLGDLARADIVDFRQYSWFVLHRKGFERQAIDTVFAADRLGRLHLSQDFKNDQQRYRESNAGGLNSPVLLPAGVP